MIDKAEKDEKVVTENQERQDKVDKKIDEMQTQMTQLKSELIEAFSKLIDEKLDKKQTPAINNLVEDWPF